MKVTIFGASGYGGQVLMRLLLDHPEVDKVIPVSSTAAGKPVDERDGGLGTDFQGKLPRGRIFLNRDEALMEQPDAVFSALPHGASADFCEPFFGQSIIFDLSADFRLRSGEVHEKAYGSAVPFPSLRSAAVYGLSEIYADEIRKSDLIAVPGCYPTCSLLPLIPIAEAGLIRSPVTVNTLSGISGAGRSAKESSLFVERSENSVAYKPGLQHRHHSEMTQELKAAGGNTPLFFT
ncbi:MAG: N-acetyl-gamma-glutamyl-phosphate reductase, partial [Spirochaetaceae bacterium]|nr:N-acetyl-gamma-glutamyl-phosphate reductase [Spirochaetaceae bacterium]